MPTRTHSCICQRSERLPLGSTYKDKKTASAPNRHSPAVGPSVRGFILCMTVFLSLSIEPRPICYGQIRVRKVDRLEQADGLAHRRFDVERLDVLPVLFEERDEEVNAQHHVREHLVFRHLDMAHGNTQAKNLL